MLRTPEAKRQAEILVAEMGLLGLSLQRGKALEVIAKLQGFKGWNELSAAASKPQAVASPLAYAVKDMPVNEALDYIESARLAAALKHASRDATTTLLNFTAPDGSSYRLQLSGQVRYEYTNADGLLVTIRSHDGLATYDAAIAAANGEVSVLDDPFFEWVSEIGDPVGEPFEDLPTDPERELMVFKGVLRLPALAT
jgi:hypothetical protein